MKNKLIFLIGMLFLLAFATGVHAMSVEYISDYQYYKPVGWNVYSGVSIDTSTSGTTFDLPLAGKNTTLFDLNSPDGTTTQWWVWVRVLDTNLSCPDRCSEIVANPPDMDFRLVCGSSGGVFHISKNLTNSTWNSGYALFRLTVNTEEMIRVAEQDVSPTGKELWTLQRDCYVQVYPDFLTPTEFVRVSFWNVNPSREALCNVDPAVTSLQETTVGLISINYQIWQILFDLFSIVIIVVAIFGLPILLFKMVHWIIEEIKKVTGGRKIF